jgi:hypothetical protein
MMTTFASPARGASGISVAAPKWPVLALGTVASLAVLAIWPASEVLWIATAGYVLGALAAPAVTVMYRFARRSAAKSPFFIPNRQLERLVLILLVIAVLAGMINAWYVATELAKQ